MAWFGKLIGGTIGFALGGPLGAILGTTFGHAFDSKNETDNRYKKTLLSSGEQAQLTFFCSHILDAGKTRQGRQIHFERGDRFH